ncbi:MAG: hypothetical protein RLZZ447_453 [Verrucomicrobiota bacterium]
MCESDGGAREKFKLPPGFRKISTLDCAAPTPVLLPAMAFRWSLANSLRGAALALLVGGGGIWLATGAHLGFTQTSVVTMKRDEITGIDYPERRAGFIAGIEFPLGTAGASIVLALLSLAADRRRAQG